jgi:hypothetical protein
MNWTIRKSHLFWILQTKISRLDEQRICYFSSYYSSWADDLKYSKYKDMLSTIIKESKPASDNYPQHII